MKSFNLNNILLFIFCSIICSCASIPEKKQIDIFEDLKLNEKQITSEIQLRENKITDLKSKVQKLINYNNKFKSQLDLENSYNIDISSLDRAFSKNKEIMDKFEIEISRLNLEIRVLKRKKDLI